MNVTCDPSLLFSVETNDRFQWTTDGDPARRLDPLLATYGLESGRACFRMLKRNPASHIFRVVTGAGGEFILRSSDARFAGLLEEQCALASHLSGHGFIRPRLTKKGGFVFVSGPDAWIAYPYLRGEIFSGDPELLAPAVTWVCGFLEEARKVKETARLYSVLHRPGTWRETLEDLTSAAVLDREPVRSLASDEVRRLAVSNRSELVSLAAQTASQPARAAEKQLTHNDLHHANILAGRDGIFGLDLEDFCYENPWIALAHSVFKLLRHSVYSGKVSAAEMRDRYFGEVLGALPAGCPLREREAFLFFARYRIFSDIRKIYERLFVVRDPVLPTDLEKKLLNLFELDYLTGGR